ncbi:hypothetical protein [Pseudoduganella namucuonensis]|uniref:Bacterial Ig-like domain-containing protein n=1 Tax=Pseudoduganella namucuonensis TaxID=1035707 RepID=A0A1I7M4T3_9BURK|nr:hypothetical protein [Pseudoduganella namucuonensis]SFV16954.1 hypothetical protein SAMN05216552_10578 [Pseudoduganella namucuonensis]
MGAKDALDCGCQGGAGEDRCGGSLPDSPRCAINYHFGMLLGVEDFRAEQGFNVGRLRRHQRALHGHGVVWGYPVTFAPERFELRVGTGYALDPLGRDLELPATQCVSLPAWWRKHRDDEEFEDIANKDDATFDADVMLGYSTCLSRPVPALADPCADGKADIAYSRICEAIQLTLARRDAAHPAPPPPPEGYHLLRLLLDLDEVHNGPDGQPLPDDQWLLDQMDAIDALPPDQQDQAEDAMWRAALARAAAATTAPGAGLAGEQLLLPLARLSGVHIHLDAGGWKAEVGGIDIDDRPTLLPTGLLQDALLAPGVAGPELPAGPVLVADGAALAGAEVTLTFNQPLAPASIAAAAFAASEFVEASGWQPFTITAAPVAADGVKLTLDRVPAGPLLRVTVIGTGASPLLSAAFIPAGALDADGDGQNLTTTIRQE